MSGPKRNPDKLNTIGVVVVGICGAVLVYVTIVALQAFYVNDTSELQTMADYGGMDKTAKGHKADEMRNITEPASNSVGPGMTPTYRIRIEDAMTLVAEDVKKDPAHLVPALPKSEKATIEPVFGRPKQAPPPAAGSAVAPGAGTSPAAAGSAAGSAAPETPAGGRVTPQVPTGAPGQPQPMPGAGGTAPGSTPTTGAPLPAQGSTPSASGPAGQNPPRTGSAAAPGQLKPKAGSAQPTK